MIRLYAPSGDVVNALAFVQQAIADTGNLTVQGFALRGIFGLRINETASEI